MQDLGTLGGSSSTGYGINNAAQVIGFSEISSGSGHMFLYSNGEMTDLGPGEGVGINDRGQIIGTAVASCTDTLHCSGYGFIYSNGQRQVVGPLPGEVAGGPTAINNAGQVTGISYPPAPPPQGTFPAHAYLYTNGQVEDLGSLGGGGVEGLAINGAGEIVGDSALSPLGGEVHAFVYLDGQMLDLNNLINPGLQSTAGVLDEATGINDRGQIVANSNNLHAYLLTPLATPVPEPCTLALCGLALLGLGLRVRIRQN